MQLKQLLLLLSIMFVAFSYSQSTISGTIVDSKTQKPIPNASITLKGHVPIKSNSLGNFQIWRIPYGYYSLKATAPGYSSYYQEINLDSEYKYLRIRMGEVTTIVGRENDGTTTSVQGGNQTTVTKIIRDTVFIEKIVYKTLDENSSITVINENKIDSPIISSTVEVPTISLTDLDKTTQIIDEDEITSGLLNASRDPFYNTAAFTFGSYRFRLRGLDNANGKLLMNNIEMNDLGIGRPYWSQWGGLNDVLKNRETTYGLEKSNFTFAGIDGATNLDIRASSQRKQLKVSYSFANRSYMHRAMATYSSGMMKGDWAVSVSGSYRFAANDAISDKIRLNQYGTTYQAYSFFAGIDKKIGKNHLLSLNVFGASNKRGKNGPATQEAMDLAGSNYYNPNWGMQTEKDGKKYIRNSRVGNLFIPTAILMHDWKLKNNSSLKTSIAYRKGINGSSAIDWANAPDPRPDYYRNMPSYALIQNDQAASDNVAELWKNNENLRQVNWDAMYEANSLNQQEVENVNGSGDTATYNISKYILSERRYDPTTINFSSVYEKIFDKISFNLGVNYANQKTHNYQKIKDLLGGEYFLNINQFALRDFPGNDSIAQQDLDNPNRILKEGDSYGYDYTNNVRKSAIWGQTVINFKKVDFFLANEISFTNFWREGHVRNGLFPNDSKGQSEIQNFTNFNLKGGLTYKVNGRNYLFVNAAYGTRAPFIRNSMLSPRTRNDFVPKLKSETLYSAEAGYILKAPKIKARLVGYAVFNEDQTSNRGVYFDQRRTFGTYVLTDINTRNIGVEAAVAIEAFTGFTITPVVAWGDHTYTSRPNATLIEDNSNTPVFEDKEVYFKGLHLANGPQAAYSVGLGYRTPSYWFFNLNFSYFDKIYIQASPVRRIDEAVDNVPSDSQLWVDILSQERMPGQFVMDASIGKSLMLNKIFKKLKKRQYLNFNLNVGNITHNTKFVTGGFEQSRFDFQEKNLSRFQNKYFYAYGINFFAGVSYRF